jgi:DNA-binding response OmpR family regulator
MSANVESSCQFMVFCNVLIIEDDTTLAMVLRDVMMSRSDFHAAVVHSLGDAMQYLQDGPVDLILLDLSLPDADGMELIRYVAGSSETPIIVVSGRNDDETRIAALSLGAEDYVCKPFNPRELLLRAEKRWQSALLRHRDVPAVAARSTRQTTEPVRICIDELSLILDSQQQVCISADGQVELTTLEFYLLLALVRANGSILSQDQLLDVLVAEVGTDRDFAPASLPVLIHRVRRKLEKVYSGESLVINVPRRGYRLHPSARIES